MLPSGLGVGLEEVDGGARQAGAEGVHAGRVAGTDLPGWVGGVEGEREARRWLVESEPGSGLEESVGWEVPPCWKVALGGGVLPVAVARGPADGCGRAP